MGFFDNDRNIGLMMGAGGIGAGLGGMFMGGGKNPATGAMRFLDQIPGRVGGYYDPYINEGRDALRSNVGDYRKLVDNPGAQLNRIGGDFQQSPGFKFALQQALQGAGHAAAAGGMAGSPQHEFQNMEIGTQLGNQDYYHWLEPTLNLYGKGLSGRSDLMHQGYQGSNSMAEQIAQMLAQKGAYSYQGQAGQNQSQGASIGNLIGGAATLAAFL